jgi:uncharacterized protein
MSAPIWVLDTNILVSGLLNPSGPPGRLLDAVLSGHLILAMDDRMFAEYSAVLHRPKFKFNKTDVRDFLAFLGQQHWINAHPLSIKELPDSSDLPFAEVALSLPVPVLVTGNPRHFPKTKLKGLRVLNPQQAWTQLVQESAI